MTVSRVLNDFPGVADETRRRVERAITTLGYQANTAAGPGGGPIGGHRSHRSRVPTVRSVAHVVRHRGSGEVVGANAQLRDYGRVW